MADEDAMKIVMPLFATDSVQSLQSVYQSAKVDPNDIDDQKYLMLQKTAKMLARLGAWIEKNSNLLPESSDLPRYFELMFEVARDLSLKVSEPVLRLWTHLLRIPTPRDSAIIQQSSPICVFVSLRELRQEMQQRGPIGRQPHRPAYQPAHCLGFPYDQETTLR